jgi:hypothetical protein
MTTGPWAKLCGLIANHNSPLDYQTKDLVSEFRLQFPRINKVDNSRAPRFAGTGGPSFNYLFWFSNRACAYYGGVSSEVACAQSSRHKGQQLQIGIE